jgi:hypothetical protein
LNLPILSFGIEKYKASALNLPILSFGIEKPLKKQMKETHGSSISDEKYMVSWNKCKQANKQKFLMYSTISQS